MGPIYESEDLTPQADGSYLGRAETPKTGFTAYFVELTFPSQIQYPFKFTTGVRVTPDRYPFPPAEPGKTRLGPKRL